MDAASRVMPTKASDDPNRAQPRSEKLEPKEETSITDIAEPIRANDRRDKDEPK